MSLCWHIGFPGSLVVKNSPANAGDVRDVGLIPGLGRSPGGGAWWPTVFLLEEFHGQRSLVGQVAGIHTWASDFSFARIQGDFELSSALFDFRGDQKLLLVPCPLWDSVAGAASLCLSLPTRVNETNSDSRTQQALSRTVSFLGNAHNM